MTNIEINAAHALVELPNLVRENTAALLGIRDRLPAPDGEAKTLRNALEVEIEAIREKERFFWRGAPSVGVYRAGYRLDSFSCAVLVEFVRRPDYRRASLAPAHPEWGEPSGPHWTIGLGPVVRSGTYAEVRKFLEGAR